MPRSQRSGLSGERVERVKAVIVIQKHARGRSERTAEARGLHYNHRLMGKDISKINQMELWSGEENPKRSEVSFQEVEEYQWLDDSSETFEGEVDSRERNSKCHNFMISLIEDTIKKKPTWKRLSGSDVDVEKLDKVFQTAVEKINENGRYKCSDAHSTMLRTANLARICDAHIKFRLFAGLGLPERGQDEVDELEQRMKHLSEKPVVEMAESSVPKLVRQGSTRIAGVRVNLNKVKADDLEERFNRLLAL
jgi:hypothetical protein